MLLKSLKKLPSAKVIVYDNNSEDNSINLAKKNGADVIVVKKEVKAMLCAECLKIILMQNILL